MNFEYCKKMALRTLIILLIAHIPHLLLFLGLEFILIIAWVGLLENIPLIFIDVNNMVWYEIEEFGVKSTSWEGTILTLLFKYIVFFILTMLFDVLFLRKKRNN